MIKFDWVAPFILTFQTEIPKTLQAVKFALLLFDLLPSYPLITNASLSAGVQARGSGDVLPRRRR